MTADPATVNTSAADGVTASLSGTKVVAPPIKYRKSFRTFVPHSVSNLPIANPFLAAEALKMTADRQVDNDDGVEAPKAPADLTSSQIHERYQKAQSARSTGRSTKNNPPANEPNVNNCVATDKTGAAEEDDKN